MLQCIANASGLQIRLKGLPDDQQAYKDLPDGDEDLKGLPDD